VEAEGWYEGVRGLATDTRPAARAGMLRGRSVAARPQGAPL